jgi:hypothetical protein
MHGHCDRARLRRVPEMPMRSFRTHRAPTVGFKSADHLTRLHTHKVRIRYRSRKDRPLDPTHRWAATGGSNAARSVRTRPRRRRRRGLAARLRGDRQKCPAEAAGCTKALAGSFFPVDLETPCLRPPARRGRAGRLRGRPSLGLVGGERANNPARAPARSLRSRRQSYAVSSYPCRATRIYGSGYPCRATSPGTD